MGRFIVKLSDNEFNYYYLEWSTVSDAPVTWGMSIDTFKGYYQAEYGDSGMSDLPSRLARVNENGHSSFGNFDTDYNRAGYKESCLTQAEIIEWYCVKKEDPREWR